MSVPVRYTAAASAEYAVVDSGLLNTLQQEEQYHTQQQQELYCQQLYNNQDNHINCHYQNYNNNNNFNVLVEQQQQQLMQQRSSMSSSVMPTAVPQANNNSNAANNNFIAMATSSSALSPEITYAKALLSSSSSAATTSKAKVSTVMDDMKPTTSAMAAAALAQAEGSENTEMQTEWMRMSADEGRYGTPGAASLEYQQHDLKQKQAINNKNISPSNDPIEPTLLDTEKKPNNSNNNQLQDELNALSSDELYNTLREYDVLQDKFHTVLLLPKESRREVTAGGRDGSAYVLRCLKMWYELPSDVLFNAMSLVDRFLDRMAVKPKHMACMSVASFHLAIKQLELKPIPAEDLVKISQCGCTAGDLERMAGVIANKLGVQMGGHAPITSVSYLRIYYALFRNLARDIGGEFFQFFEQLIKLEEMENRLEILMCDVKTTVITPSTLALVLICLHLDFHIKESYTKGRPELKHVFEYILSLQTFMKIPDRIFTRGFSIVSGILSHYNGQNKQPYKQRLVWRLSTRTLRVLRPTNRFSSDLPTIQEGISNALDDACRSRTESVSSEEEEDWPTSPIIPIFEQC